MNTPLDFETQMQTVPVRNERLKVFESSRDKSVLLVEVELRYRGLLAPLAVFLKSRRSKKYELSGLSRELFERIDGHVSVEQLIDSLCADEQLTFLESRALVMLYLKDLMRRGLVAIVPGSSLLADGGRG